eukprot:TRINITY_DN25152_c0_g2_i4.p2 TRINITY_DN25152_c0_g2~~TRINITY_DN25152_c0_g2_i4.p2  ORF type:complete len:185 (+),score=21.79 TRINITY_DN25152_c0_g2_i4:45-599(+)
MAPMIWSAAGSGHRPLEATLGSRGGPHDAVASSNSAKCVSADLYGRDFDYMDGVPLVLCTLRTPEALFTPAEWRTLREAATLRDSSAPGRMLGKACSVPDFWPVDSRSPCPSTHMGRRTRTGYTPSEVSRASSQPTQEHRPQTGESQISRPQTGQSSLMEREVSRSSKSRHSKHRHRQIFRSTS